MNIEKEILPRRFLEVSAALGGLVAYGDLSSVFAQENRPLTDDQVLGPFYPIKSPLTEMLISHISGGAARVQKGRSFTCWDALLTRKVSHYQEYDLKSGKQITRYAHINDPNPAPLDPNFQGYPDIVR